MMYQKAFVVAIVVCSIAPAHAQQTTCRTIGGTTTCNTQGQLQLANPDYGILGQGQSVSEAIERSQAASDAHNKSVAEAGMIEVWKRCRARWNEAIEKRDFELADALAKGCPATP